MANALRGEVALEVGGKTYKLKYNTNAICEFESVMGCGLIELGQMARSIKSVRAMIWSGLQEFHPEVTLKQVSAWFDEYGVEKFMEPMSKMIDLAHDDKKESDAADPPAQAADSATG